MTDTMSGAADSATTGWRAPLQRLEYATLRVKDLGETLDWYLKALNLKVIDQSSDHALLTCGGDNNVDLALRLDAKGTGKGLESYSFGIDSAAGLEILHQTLQQRGVQTERLDIDLPGLNGALRIVTPTGVYLQVVASNDRATGVRNTGREDGVTPVDTDHVNLLAGDVREYAQWLATTLGFVTSDAVASPAGWGAAWTHITPQHHDVAILATADPSTKLHHVAFLAEDLNHMGEIADNVCSLGVDRCEWGIGKHGGLGANNFLYCKDPSGNRIEINSNMNDNPFERATQIYPGDEFESFIQVWNFQGPPPSFRYGS
ncbi:VOC family protein [Rhodococcus sp. USK13]|uniref:VOC family protein n=1 Tax=Rhodococcus sp. USK13 TaxID=2806442 RepID=UPI001BCFB1D9|nr:VOC family protein [Rhodococcus sp. USK13]